MLDDMISPSGCAEARLVDVCALAVMLRVWGGQIFGEDMEEDYELGEALRGDITDNPLDIYMRVRGIMTLLYPR